tara:strand:+ start:105 stop:281 length:177 start_codon:yes stop_codon:yes gene_type:complete
MAYDYKKCTFVKMSGKGRDTGRKKKLEAGYKQNQKAKALSDWRKSWFKGEYELSESKQ